MTNEDKVAELKSAINAILEAAERGNDDDHDALAVIEMECVDVLKSIANTDFNSSNFTVTATYDREEILGFAKHCQDEGANLFKTRDVLNQLFPAWFLDTRTSLTVELMFRDESDMFYEFMTARLAEITA